MPTLSLSPLDRIAIVRFKSKDELQPISQLKTPILD